MKKEKGKIGILGGIGSRKVDIKNVESEGDIED